MISFQSTLGSLVGIITSMVLSIKIEAVKHKLFKDNLYLVLFYFIYCLVNALNI